MLASGIKDKKEDSHSDVITNLSAKKNLRLSVAAYSASVARAPCARAMRWKRQKEPL